MIGTPRDDQRWSEGLPLPRWALWLMLPGIVGPALIFGFIRVDAEQSIHDQHHAIRRLFREGEQRPWSDWNLDAVVEWLAMRGARA